MRKVLIVAIVILSLILAGMIGFIWYQNSHIFVEDAAYSKGAKELDLRGENISFEHFLTVQSQLPNCRILWDVPFQGGKVSSDTAAITLTTLTREDIQTMAAYFPDLKRVDASACGDYELLVSLKQKLKDCEVVYQVDLGGSSAQPSETALTLEPGQYDPEVLMTNLAFLPDLASIHFRNAQMTQEQMEALDTAYPAVEKQYTAEIFGKEYDIHTTQLDLSSLTSADVEEVAGRLGVLTSLETVELMKPDGTSQLTLEDVKILVDAAPDAVFHYTFTFYGNTISTTDTQVHMKKVKPDENILTELRKVLAVMETCERFVLEMGQYDMIKKNVTSAELAEIREEFRDRTKLVWRVYFGDNGSSLTDAEVLRVVYGLMDDNCATLRYLEDVRYMDIGHNEFLDYADFISGMTSLEAVIISGAPIKSLEPFAACKNLKFLEMVECHYIPDLEPLRACTQLEMLNISHTEIADLSPLEGIKLTHLNTINNDVPEEQIEAFMEANPDCWTVTTGNHYGVGWRYDTDERTLLEWYAKLDAEYHYISQRNIPNNIGWYLPDDEE